MGVVRAAEARSTEPSTPLAGASRVALTPAAEELLVRMTRLHGPLMFHQSGGCCDGSAPMCYPAGEFQLGGSDIHLGDLRVDGLAPIGFHMSESQFEYWKHTHLTVDVVPGRGSGFSVEAPEGVRFLIRSRLFTDVESAQMNGS
jgi:uncharacterized protein (DUF779 family)